MIRQRCVDVRQVELSRVPGENSPQSVRPKHRARSNPLEDRGNPLFSQQMIAVRDDAVFGIEISEIFIGRLDVDDLSIGVADHEIRRAGAVGGKHRPQRFAETPGVQNLRAANMDGHVAFAQSFVGCQ